MGLCNGYAFHSYFAATKNDYVVATGTGQTSATERVFIVCSQCGDTFEIAEEEERQGLYTPGG